MLITFRHDFIFFCYAKEIKKKRIEFNHFVLKIFNIEQVHVELILLYFVDRVNKTITDKRNMTQKEILINKTEQLRRNEFT